MLFKNVLVRSLLLMALLSGGELIGQANTLLTNGKVRVRGADWRNTRITVMPQFGEAFEVPLPDANFNLDMGVFSTYLVRAAHPGCASKEIVFDLWVPDAYRNSVFHFPFEIMLETFRADEKPYSYEHPVGAVFFDASIADFTYTTDYKRIEQARSLSTLEKRMATHISLHPIPVDEMAVYENYFAQDPNAEEPVRNAPEMDLTSVPSAQHTTLPPESRPDPETPPRPITAAQDPVPLSTSRDLLPDANRPSSDPRATSADTNLAKRMATSSHMSTRLEIQPPRQDVLGHELSILPTMVIVIDRFGKGTTSMEVRKVTHAYGAVFYFQDGMAITERDYNERLAEFARPGQTDR